MRLRFAMLGAVLATLVVAVSPGVAAAAPRHNHGLTINATPNPIVAGQGVLIYGQLKGAPVAGQTIRLYHRVNPSPFFTLIGTTTTDSFGFYKFTREEGVVMSNRSWFVRGPGFTHSRTVHEHVAAQVSINASSTTLTPVRRSRSPDSSRRATRASACSCRSRSATATTGGRSTAACSTARRATRSRTACRCLTIATSRAVLRTDPRNIRSESDPVTVTIQQAQVADFTINTSSPIIPEGSAATISGVLDMPGTTTPEPSTGVSLWGRTRGQGHFLKLQDATTGTDGSYSFTVQPTVNTVYQVRTTFAPARHTAVLFEGVQDVLQFAADQTTTTVGGKVTFTGSVTPDKPGHLVYLQRLGSDNDWHLVEVTRVRPNSTFQFAWRFGKAGSEQFRARIFSDRSNIGGHSTPVTITVSPARRAGVNAAARVPRGTSRDSTPSGPRRKFAAGAGGARPRRRLARETRRVRDHALAASRSSEGYAATAHRRQVPGTPFSSRSPRSSNGIPEPTTRSLTVPDTSTSPGRALAPTRAPMCTAMPPTSLPITSISPVCRPLRTSRPNCGARGVPDRGRASDRAGGPVERREEAVAHRLHRAAAEARQLAPDRRLDRLEHVAPAAVAQLRRALGRVDDVGEHHRREDPLGVGGPARAGQELLDLVEQRRRSRRRTRSPPRPASSTYRAPGMCSAR